MNDQNERERMRLEKLQNEIDAEENNPYKIEPKLKKILKDNCFRLNDLNNETKHAYAKNSSEANDDNEGERNFGEEETNVVGRIASNDLMFQPITENNKEDSVKKTKIEGFPDLVFYKIPFKSRFFIYDIDGVYKKPSFFCKYIEYSAIPFTLEVAYAFLEKIGGDIPQYIMNIASDDFCTNPRGVNINSMPVERKDFISYVESLNDDIKLELLKENAESKRYFLSEEITVLCAKRKTRQSSTGLITESPSIYNYDQIVNMSWDDIKRLYDQIRTDPYTLAFSDLITFKYFPSREMIKSNPNIVEGYIPLPELSFFMVKLLCELFKTTVINSEKKLAAVKIYDLLKTQTFTNKHAYTVKSYLRQHMYQEFDTEDFEAGLAFLVEKSIVLMNIHEEVFIRYVYMWEKCIALSFEVIMKRGKEIRQEKKDASYYEKMTTHAGFPLCTEQLEAVRKFYDNPFIVVNGSPGSGKTDMLGIVAKLLDRKKILATASQSLNVARLNQIFPGRSFTAHKLLYFHDSFCKSSPHSLSRNKTGDQAKELGIDFKDCPFEDVSVLFCEEFSMWDEALFSKLVSAIACCGKLTKVMMIGDTKQLQSIRMGNTMRELSSFAEKMGLLCKFTHDHRTDKATKILWENQNAIRLKETQNIRFDGVNCIHVDVARHMSKSDKIKMIGASVQKILRKFDIKEYDHHVITRMNEYKNEIIRVVNTYYHNKDTSTRSTGTYDHRGHYIGRKLAVTQNNYKKGLSNNEIMILTRITDQLTVDPEKSRPRTQVNTVDRLDRGYTRTLHLRTLLDSRVIEIQFDDWVREHLKKCSASTVNTFQGSEIQDIIFVLPFASAFDTFELVNTAWSRCKKRLIFIGNLEDLYNAIDNPEPLRRSKLCALLIESCFAYKYQPDSIITKSEDKNILPTTESIFSLAYTQDEEIDITSLDMSLQGKKTDRPFSNAMEELMKSSKTEESSKENKTSSVLSERQKTDAIETRPSAKYSAVQLLTLHKTLSDTTLLIAKHEADASASFVSRTLEIMKTLFPEEKKDPIFEQLLHTMLTMISGDTIYSKSAIDSRATSLYTSVMQKFNDDQEKDHVSKHSDLEQKNTTKREKSKGSKKDKEEDPKKKGEKKKEDRKKEDKKKRRRDESSSSEEDRKSKKEKSRKKDDSSDDRKKKRSRSDSD